MLQVTSADFKSIVLDSTVPVLVDFWAPWCGPCKMFGKILEETAPKLDGKIKICKVNVEEAGEVASTYGIMSIPAIFIFKNGQVVANKTGALSAVDLEKFVYNNI